MTAQGLLRAARLGGDHRGSPRLLAALSRVRRGAGL